VHEVLQAALASPDASVGRNDTVAAAEAA
jgi:hypothetical protein